MRPKSYICVILTTVLVANGVAEPRFKHGVSNFGGLQYPEGFPAFRLRQSERAQGWHANSGHLTELQQLHADHPEGHQLARGARDRAGHALRSLVLTACGLLVLLPSTRG